MLMKKENILEIRKKSSLPVRDPSGNHYLKFKKGDIISVKKLNIKKHKFPFLDPKIIMGTVVALIILVAGIFAFGTLWFTLEEDDTLAVSSTNCRTVTNPALQQTITIPEGATITRVYETLNTGATQNIDTGNYTQAGTTVTINVTG